MKRKKKNETKNGGVRRGPARRAAGETGPASGVRRPREKEKRPPSKNRRASFADGGRAKRRLFWGTFCVSPGGKKKTIRSSRSKRYPAHVSDKSRNSVAFS